MKYARIKDNIAIEVIDFDPTGLYHSDFKWVEVPDSVDPNSKLEGSEWVKPDAGVQAVEPIDLKLTVSNLASDDTNAIITGTSEIVMTVGSTISFTLTSDVNITQLVKLPILSSRNGLFTEANFVDGVALVSVKIDFSDRLHIDVNLMNNLSSEYDIIMNDLIIYTML